MSDSTTPQPQPAPEDVDAQLARIKAQYFPQQPYTPPAPVDRSAASLLGAALGGGTAASGMTPAEEEAAGNRALLNFGLNMLSASGYSHTPRTFGQIFAQGVGGAEQSLGGSEAVSMSRLAAQQAYAQQQQQNRLEALKEAIPLLQMQQTAARGKALLGGAVAPGTSIATAGGPPAPGSIGAPIVPRDPNAGTAGQQANNPGNIMLTPGSVPTGATGAVPVSGGRYVASFPDVPTGVAAHSDLLTNYAQSGVGTIRDAVTRWVGPTTDPAILKSYTAAVAKAAGVGPDDKVDLSDPKLQRAFILAQQPQESGKAWLSPADVDKGLALAAARRAGAPKTAGAPVVAQPPAGPPGGSAAPPEGPPRAPPVITDQPPPSSTAGGPPGGPATVQVAGPSVPTGGAVAAVSPGVPGDVNAIIRGIVGAGGSPTTLQPPGPPAPPPSVQTAGPGAPTAPLAAEALPLPDAAAKAAATKQNVPIQGGNGWVVTPDGTVKPPAAAQAPPSAQAPTPPAAYVRQPLPPDIQSRIDHPETPAITEAYRNAIAGATTTEQQNAAIEARTTAIEKARADAITQGEAWQTKQQEQWQQDKQKQVDIQAAKDAAAATRQQEIDLEKLRNNDAQANTAIQDERTANRTRITSLRTDADSAQQDINTIQLLRSVESGLPEEGSIGAYLSRRYPDSVYTISKVLGLNEDQVRALTAQELFSRVATTLGTQLSQKAKEGAGTARGAEITQNMAALPTTTMNHMGRIQSLALLQNMAQFRVNHADAAESYLSTHVSTDPLIAGKVNTLNGFPQDFERNGPPIIPRIAPNASPDDVYKGGIRPGMLADFPQPIKDATGAPRINPKTGQPLYSYKRGILGDDGKPIWIQ